MKLEILSGQPEPEEYAALAAALVVLARQRAGTEPPIPEVSHWLQASRLATVPGSWPIPESDWVRSARLAQPWQS